MASNAERLDFPYRQIMQKLNEGFSFILENAPLLIEAAKVIVTAVTSRPPELRYTVGDDAAAMLQANRNMSDSKSSNL